jgi:hypothetical protein
MDEIRTLKQNQTTLESSIEKISKFVERKTKRNNKKKTKNIKVAQVD